MPPLPGQSRSLLQFTQDTTNTIADLNDFVNEVITFVKICLIYNKEVWCLSVRFFALIYLELEDSQRIFSRNGN